MTMTAPAPAPNYSCLLPLSFTGLTDVQDFLTQFEAVSTLSNWAALNPDPRPHFFSARLTGDALTFYRSLTTAQKGDYDELKRLFRQQYKPNADVLKAQVKSLRQLPGQDVSAFYRTLRDLAGKAYTDDAVRNELLLTTFIEGWPILSFGGKSEKPNQQWLRTHSVWHLKCNLICTSTANSPTLPRRLLTI